MHKQPVKRVLEIGTGSGYQAAVLSKLVDQVYTIERIRSLSHRAGSRFRDLGLRNIQSRYVDGVDGWADEGPFDAVIVTAAMETVPPCLLAQIKHGGVLVGPVGPQRGSQQLAVMRCRADQEPQVQMVENVKFVPFLTGIC